MQLARLAEREEAVHGTAAGPAVDMDNMRALTIDARQTEHCLLGEPLGSGAGDVPGARALARVQRALRLCRGPAGRRQGPAPFHGRACADTVRTGLGVPLRGHWSERPDTAKSYAYRQTAVQQTRYTCK